MQTLALDLCYLALALLVGPFYLLWRLGRGRGLISPWRRLGFVAPAAPGPGPLVWLHAVSVGESLAVRALVERLQVELPLARVLLTTTTLAGLKVAETTFGAERVRPSPFDLGCAQRRFLHRIKPSLLVLVEGELWPNQLRLMESRAIPVVLASGKLSKHSARGYRRLLAVLPHFLDGVTLFLMQDEEQARRLLELGVPRERVRVGGNIKLANLAFQDPGPSRRRLKARLGWAEKDPVLVAGSTHGGEEALVVAAFKRARAELPGLRLVLAPRHIERKPEVLDLLRRAGLGWILLSQMGKAAQKPVLVVDTLGELSTLYALGEVAFVGGTLVPVGGHNLLEPMAFGLPVLAGPQLFKVREMARELLGRGLLQVVEDADSLAGKLLEFMGKPEKLLSVQEGARAFIQTRREPVGETFEALQAVLEGRPKGSL